MLFNRSFSKSENEVKKQKRIYEVYEATIKTFSD